MGRRGRVTVPDTSTQAAFLANFDGRGSAGVGGGGPAAGRRRRGRACEGTGQFQCTKCGNRYKQKQTLRNHHKSYTIAQRQDNGETTFVKERWCATLDAEKISAWKQLQVVATTAAAVSRRRQNGDLHQHHRLHSPRTPQ